MRVAVTAGIEWQWQNIVSRVGLLPLTALVVVADLTIRRAQWPNWHGRMWLAYLAGVAMSAGFWHAMLLLSRWGSTRSRLTTWLGVATLVFASNFVVVCTFGYFLTLGDYPVATALEYILEEPSSATAFMGPYIRDPSYLAAVTLVPLLVMAWWIFVSRAQAAAAQPSRVWRHARWAAPLVVGAVAILPFPGNYAFLCPDAHAVVQTLNAARLKLFWSQDRLHAGHRFKVPPQAPRRRPNILWIVHEALSPRQMSIYGGRWDTAPEHARLVEEAGDQVVVFRDAQTNSGYTLISIVSMMTGLSPDRTSLDFHSAPLPWDWARAADYDTFLYAAQSYAWGSFDLFLLSPSLQTAINAESSGLPVVNDVGVDDGLIVDRALTQLRSEAARPPESPPFFGVIHFNGTHFPFLERDPYKKDWDVHTPRDNRKLNAVYYVDAQVGRIWDTLKETGLDRDTVVIITSDHGSRLMGEGETHTRGRAENHYEVILRVPMLIYIPRGLETVSDEARLVLRENRDRRVANVDLLPTVVDLMHIDGADVQELRANLDGRSLLRPVKDDRWLVYTNVTSFQGRERTGFALTRGDSKVVFFNHDAGCDEEFYDLHADPRELHNLWGTLPAPRRAEVEAEIARRPWLRAIRERADCGSP